MKRLLEELKAIDPDCYDEIWAWALWLEDPEFGDYEPNDPGYLKHRDDVIQGACQRAITSRGWTWEITDLPIGIYNACINHIAPGYSGDRYEPDHEHLIVESTEISPAKAILSAYVAARKACP